MSYNTGKLVRQAFLPVLDGPPHVYGFSPLSDLIVGRKGHHGHHLVIGSLR
jgi:hypothetical protein